MATTTTAVVEWPPSSLTGWARTDHQPVSTTFRDVTVRSGGTALRRGAGSVPPSAPRPPAGVAPVEGGRGGGRGKGAPKGRGKRASPREPARLVVDPGAVVESL